MIFRQKSLPYAIAVLMFANIARTSAFARVLSQDLLHVADSYDMYGCKGENGDIGWYVERGSQIDQKAESQEILSGWRMRVKSSLSSYCLESGNVQYLVRLTVNPTIRVKLGKGCCVEKLIGAKDRIVMVRAETLRMPSLFLDECRASLPDDKTNGMMMCAYGIEPLHRAGSMLEYALFMIGCETLAFAYRIGDDVGVKSVSMPIPNDSFSNGRPEVSGGTVSVYDAKHSVSVSVEHEHETTLSRLGKFLILTVQGPDTFVVFPISMKNVLSFRECLKARQNGLDCSWRAEITKNDRSPLLF